MSASLLPPLEPRDLRLPHQPVHGLDFSGDHRIGGQGIDALGQWCLGVVVAERVLAAIRFGNEAKDVAHGR